VLNPSVIYDPISGYDFDIILTNLRTKLLPYNSQVIRVRTYFNPDNIINDPTTYITSNLKFIKYVI